MKKPLAFLILFLLVGIAALGIISYKPPTPEYLALEDQFNTYLGKDLTEDAHFVSYMNDLQLEHVSENVKINVTINQTVYEQSGIIMNIIGLKVYVVTIDDYIDVTKHQNIVIYDYKNKMSMATVEKVDSVLGIALLSFTVDDPNDYSIPTGYEYLPLEGEVISGISCYEGMLNHVSIGTFGALSTEGYHQINLEYDLTCLGGSVYDINLNLVGMQVLKGSLFSVLLYDDLYTFANE